VPVTNLNSFSRVGVGRSRPPGSAIADHGRRRRSICPVLTMSTGRFGLLSNGTLGRVLEKVFQNWGMHRSPTDDLSVGKDRKQLWQGRLSIHSVRNEDVSYSNPILLKENNNKYLSYCCLTIYCVSETP
jgi:hypothetical protein